MKSTKKRNPKAIPFQPHPLDPRVKFKIGEIVWAKMRGFPPWPAIVAQLSQSASSDDSDEIQQEKKQESSKAEDERISRKEAHLIADNTQQNKILISIDRENSQNNSQIAETRLSQDTKDSPQVKFKPYRQKLLFEEEEKITVNFIGENTHATISVSRVQKWTEYYAIYSKNRRVRLQPAIKEALRILKNEITYEEHMAENLKRNEELSIIEILDDSEPEQEEEIKPKKKYIRKKPRVQERGFYSKKSEIHERHNTRSMEEDHRGRIQYPIIAQQQISIEEEKQVSRERERSRTEEGLFCEIKNSQQNLQNFMRLNEQTNFTFIEPMIETLQRLESKSITVSVLQETKIGRTLQRLFTHCNQIKQDYLQNQEVYSEKYDRIKGLALQILCKWRFLVQKCLFQGQNINEKLLLKSNYKQTCPTDKPPTSLIQPRVQTHKPSIFRQPPRREYIDLEQIKTPPLSPRSKRIIQDPAREMKNTEGFGDPKSSLTRKRNQRDYLQMRAPPPLIGANVVPRLDSYYK